MNAPAGERPSTLGRATVLAGVVLFFHAAYSIYEFLSQGKSLDLGTGSTQYENTIPLDMRLETLVAFAVLVLGCALTVPRLRPIAWSARMRETSIDCVDARAGFANVRHRGGKLFGMRE
ncbi:Uncharacterized protein MSYG_0148 [Malassezia sympodialis ATCC 42132]|uniref:Uncharacterized protein n=2 Tax=Malassezia sympodialis (strain ATCC 42132) TaxID=1230383 RepID=A0A1M8A049_MALS4|nr:Uncharacterized protein MSYG_0148 [Malassezia sympodialis ATCC 42132]